MNVEIDGVDVMAAAEIATLVGGIVATLVIALLVYLLVRPPRHVREARRRPIELQESEAEQLLDVMDRMEARLEVLERALADHRSPAVEPAEQAILEAADQGRETRRTK